MTAYAWIDEEGVHEIPAGTWFIGPEGESYPADWIETVSHQMRAARGIKAIVEPDDVPAGKRSIGYTLSAPGGVPTRSWTLEDIPLEEAKAARIATINAMRDAKIDGGFAHAIDGVTYTFQSAPSDRENIQGMGTLAKLAIGAGAEADDYRWADPANDFRWITADNQTPLLDAQEMSALYDAGVAFKTAKTFWARGLKDAVLAASDYAAVMAIDIDATWP